MEFYPLQAITGGILIGISVMLLLLFNGRIAGISGMMGSLMSSRRSDLFWRLFFLVGFGTRMGNGCNGWSHNLRYCPIIPSLFDRYVNLYGKGFITVFIIRHWLG